MDLELDGRVVVITGGTEGLGRALAGRLVAEGAAVAICARRAERVEQVTADLVAAGGDVLGLPVDVTDLEQLRRLVDATVARWGRIDGVVNNAGRSTGKPVVDITDDEWHEDLELKLYAAARLTRLAVAHLRERGGSVVNVLSIAAKAPGAGSAPSSVVRAAGMSLTKVLSKELGPAGVRVNAVLVGFVESDQWVRRAAASGTPLPELYEQMAAGAHVPLGRVGRAEEFADLAAYLLSARSSYVTGTAINVDGGLSTAV